MKHGSQDQMKVAAIVVTSFASSLLVAGLASGQDAKEAPSSVEECVRYALTHNPLVLVARQNAAGASARLSEAKASQLGVDLDVNGTVTRQGPVISFPTGPGQSTTVVPASRRDYSLSLSKPLYTGGALEANLKAARHDLSAAGRDVEGTMQEVAHLVYVTYSGVLQAQRLKQVADEAVAQAKEHLRIARVRFEAGTAAKFDVLRSEVELANRQEQALVAANQVELSRAAFNNALGRPHDTPVELPEVKVEFQQEFDESAALKAASQNRPLLQSLREQLESAKQRTVAAKAGRLPSVALAWDYMKQTVTGFSEDHSWHTYLSFNLPLFDCGLARSQEREAKTYVGVLESSLQNAQQQVGLEIRQAILTVRSARARVETAAKAMEQAAEGLRIAEVRYQAEVGANVEVTDARVAMVQAQTNHANAFHDYRVAVAALQKATGELARDLITELLAGGEKRIPERTGKAEQ